MAAKKVSKSADELYREARGRWVEIVALDVYDDPDVITPVAGLLERARAQDPGHVKSLALLSDILMELGANGEAMEVIETLVRLEPGNESHATKKSLVQELQRNRTAAAKDAVRDFVEGRWTRSKDW